MRHRARVPLKPAYRAVGADEAELDPDEVLAGGEMGERVARALHVIRMHELHVRPRHELLARVAQHALERCVQPPEVAVEADDAEQVGREIEELAQLVVRRGHRHAGSMTLRGRKEETPLSRRPRKPTVVTRFASANRTESAGQCCVESKSRPPSLRCCWSSAASTVRTLVQALARCTCGRVSVVTARVGTGMARPGSDVLGMCLCPWTTPLPLKTIRTRKQSTRPTRAFWQGRVACGLRARSGAAACRCTGRLAPVWSWLRARAGVGIGDSRALAPGPAAGAAGEVGAGRAAARGRGGGAPDRHLADVLLAAIAAHVALVVVGDPSNLALFDPLGAPWRAKAAVASCVALAALIASSVLRRRLRLAYARWRGLHVSLGLGALALGVLHAIGVDRYLAGPAGLPLAALAGSPRSRWSN